MNGTAEYVMAFDLGSSKIVAGLGKKDENGILRIYALKHMPSDSEIRRGIVHNMEDVAGTVRKLKEDLSHSQTPPLFVNHVYVGINGYSMRTKDVRLVAQMFGEEQFTQKDLDELTDQIQENLPEGFNNVDVFTQEFVIDGKLDKNPIGTTPKRVEANFKIVGGSDDLTRKTDAVFQNLRLTSKIAIGPLASAEAVLTADEKSKGAVCVDFGAETTSICILKGDLVRFVSVLPFGGRNITNDLLQLNIDEEDAENLKLQKGSALHFSELENEDGREPFSKSDQEVNDIILARIEEIVENIWAQINRCGIEPAKILSGIVMTGGASLLPDLTKLLERKTGMPVRMGDVGLYLDSESQMLYKSPAYARCIGLLLQGTDGCYTVTATDASPYQEEVKTPSVQEINFDGAEFHPEPKAEVKEEETKSKKEKKVKPPKPPRPPKEPKDSSHKSLADKIKERLAVVADYLNNEN